jgi:predicted NAD-dependent protein-ADP-ribosyltransferase YbiA (DUF1768 family)
MTILQTVTQPVTQRIKPVGFGDVSPTNGCPQVVSVAIDSLYLRLGQRGAIPSTWLLERYKEWREYKDSYSWANQEKPLMVEFPGLGTFRLLPRGHRPYEFTFVNPEIGDIHIWNPDKWGSSQHTGQILLDYRSKYLQQQSLWLNGVSSFNEECFKLFYHLKREYERYEHMRFIKVVRVDIAVDVTHNFTWSDLPRFVKRAKKVDSYTVAPLLVESLQSLQNLLQDADSPNRPLGDNKGGGNYNEGSKLEIDRKHLGLISQLVKEAIAAQNEPDVTRVISTRDVQTIYFGRFASELYGRLYDKTASLEVQGKQWMRGIWADNGWDGESKVWRMEFSLSGDYLKNCHALVDDEGKSKDLRNFVDFLCALPSIWKYLTTEWLRHTNPECTNQSRWKTSEVWTVIQKALESSDIAWRQKRRAEPEPKQIKAQTLGCLLTWAAYQSKAHYAIQPHAEIQEYLFSDRFLSDLIERRKLLGQDDFTDTAISAHMRTVRMLRGEGS